MRTAITIITIAVVMLPFAGCYRNAGVSQGWQTSSGGGRTTAVDSAIELTDKYTRLSEEAVTLRTKNQELETENQRLKTDLKVTQDRMEKAQKDLNEVNDLMVEMRLELNNWKSDVLGFRSEIRDAEKAQLEALVKILKILGAEPRTDLSTQSEPAKTAPTRPASVPEEHK
jgi:chromosome segregation ATPase